MLDKHEINEATLKTGEVLDADHIEKNHKWSVDDVKGIDSIQQFAEKDAKKQGETKGNAPKNVKPKELNAKVPMQEGVKPKYWMLKFLNKITVEKLW